MGSTQVQPPEKPFCDLDSPGREGLLVVQLYLMPSFFLGVLILGLPLNLLSLWIFFHRLKRWTRSAVLLFNLSLADTSWLLALPFLVNFHLDHLHWRLGLPLCKAVRLLYHNYFYLSIFFVTCISMDRYLAIVHPLRSLALLGRRKTGLLCVMVWVVAFILSIPVASMTLTQSCPRDNRTICTLYVILEETGRSLPYTLVCTIGGFLFPLVSICYCYVRSVKELRCRPCQPQPYNKWRRLVRVLSAALILFALFYLPYHLSRNATIVIRAIYPDSPSSWQLADLIFALEMCFCSLSTCVNPLFSCFIGHQFKREFQRICFALFPQCPRMARARVLSRREQRTAEQRREMTKVTPL
ncbi:P2Y purinoceptor 4-like [Lampris incognitus]|uniref:P2Y purinoceptor 4-like n=1 Tax=Lampris incognitus TaxID=2546036 RepID=UPI0024B56B90|nr:P2Y purinoceptor 4-like [Lampris incognitus]